jgi:hypothetical protein
LKSGSLSAESIRWACWWLRTVPEYSRQGRWFPTLPRFIASKANKQAFSHSSTTVLSLLLFSYVRNAFFTLHTVQYITYSILMPNCVTRQRRNYRRLFHISAMKLYFCCDEITNILRLYAS